MAHKYSEGSRHSHQTKCSTHLGPRACFRLHSRRNNCRIGTNMDSHEGCQDHGQHRDLAGMHWPARRQWRRNEYERLELSQKQHSSPWTDHKEYRGDALLHLHHGRNIWVRCRTHLEYHGRPDDSGQHCHVDIAWCSWQLRSLGSPPPKNTQCGGVNMGNQRRYILYL